MKLYTGESFLVNVFVAMLALFMIFLCCFPYNKEVDIQQTMVKEHKTIKIKWPMEQNANGTDFEEEDRCSVLLVSNKRKLNKYIPNVTKNQPCSTRLFKDYF